MFSNNLLDHAPKDGRTWVVAASMAVTHPVPAIQQLLDAVAAQNARGEALSFLLTLVSMHSTKKWPRVKGVRFISAFFSNEDRHGYRPEEEGELPSVEAIDEHFSNVGKAFEEMGLDLLLTQATPPREVVDKDGTTRTVRSLGTNCDYTWNLIEHGIPVYVVENPRLPFVNGNQFDESHVVGVMHSDAPLHEYVAKPSNSPEADNKIADEIVRLVPKGSTVQIGVGYLPSLILEKLAAAGKVGAIWSEVLTPSMMNLPPGTKMVGTFALGDQKFYDWLSDNPDVQLLPVEITNNAEEIRKRKVFSINTAMKVLPGGGSVVGAGRRHSGPGGAREFGAAAFCRILALHSVRLSRTGKTLSNNVATWSGKYDHRVLIAADRPDYVVTENGVAWIRPHRNPDGTVFTATKAEVTMALIMNCVHPQLRADAIKMAFEAGIPAESRIGKRSR